MFGEESSQTNLAGLLLEKIINRLIDDEGNFWKRVREDPISVFGDQGINQFILDLKFTIEAAGEYLSKDCMKDLVRGIESATESYTKERPDFTPKPDIWFKELIRGHILGAKTLRNFSKA